MIERYNNTIWYSTEYCGNECIEEFCFIFLFLTWFCCCCCFCIRDRIKHNVLYLSGIKQVSDCENDELLESGGLVIIGRNIEKPPEYVE